MLLFYSAHDTTPNITLSVWILACQHWKMLTTLTTVSSTYCGELIYFLEIEHFFEGAISCRAIIIFAEH
jgi:hypothetical protein